METLSCHYFRIDKITDWQGFHALKPEWNKLLSNSNADNFFLTYEWLSTWARHFGSKSEPFVLIARDTETGELAGATPLVIERNSLIKKLIFMGNGPLQTDHLDFIMREGKEQEIAQALTATLCKQMHRWDTIFFDGLKSSSDVLQNLRVITDSKQDLIYNEICPYLPLPENWASLRQTLGKNLRYNLGRYQRKLEKNFPGAISFQTVKNESELARVMPKLYQLHHKVLIAKENKNGIFEEKRIEEFSNEMSLQALASDNLRLHSLSVDHKIIAVLYCFQYKNRVYYYQAGYDSDWKTYSPGRLLMAYAIENAIAEGMKVFDFLRGDEAYKSAWTRQYHIENRIHFPSSLKGRISLLPLVARNKIKKFLA